jgi:hypothetical protein
MMTHMATNGVGTTDNSGDTNVMASIEDGHVDRFVIADVTRDDAYLTLPLVDAACLSTWR